jgi:cytochrome oxidase Cu insertion factor (SCO1/SenC/PrrC family)
MTMPDPNGLDVHDIQVAHVPSFDQNGKPLNHTVVTYHVGPHGPFVHTYKSGEVTPDQVNGDINKQVADLRAIVVRP